MGVCLLDFAGIRSSFGMQSPESSTFSEGVGWTPELSLRGFGSHRKTSGIQPTHLNFGRGQISLRAAVDLPA